MKKLYSMKGSFPVTFATGIPRKHTVVQQLWISILFSLAWIKTTASTVQYITLKHKTDIAEGNKRKEERPEICDINPKELTCFQMCLI